MIQTNTFNVRIPMMIDHRLKQKKEQSQITIHHHFELD